MAYRRTKPYTLNGISRVPCFRCGQPSRFQWQVCADDNTFRGLCAECDVALNALVLNWMGHPGVNVLMANYRASVEEG